MEEAKPDIFDPPDRHKTLLSGSISPSKLPRPKLKREIFSQNHIPALDGLRAIAVLAVMFSHGSYGFLPGGFVGVELIFVLSGFLITRLLVQEQMATGRIHLKLF
jgi:peptidoglycan/LPS O-acetylase OafA/YrhL